MKIKILSFFPDWEAMTKLITIMKISIFLLLTCAFSVSASIPLKAQKLTLNMENATIRQIFDELVLSPNAVQQHRVTGTIKDITTEEPLPGVNIVVEGTTSGVISDINGKYSIVSDPKGFLVFSFIGYYQLKIAVEGRITIDVSMTQDIKALEEVVVVGYGTAKKRNVTSAVASFTANNLEERPISRVDQALVGQMAGVQVKQTTGSPGKAFSI